MIAFHFPPAAISSGHLRTLGFARYLPGAGWKPIVLSATRLAYPRVSPIKPGVIPPDCIVRRSFALDTSRHLAVRGRYPGFLAQPDRWATWWIAAVASGLRLIRRHRVDAIWSTYPIMTAHHIAYTLQRLTRIPWVADFRDPVHMSVEAGNPHSVASQAKWEERVLQRASRITFTTLGARQDYAARYPSVEAAGKLAVIPNGYDDSAFAGLPSPPRRGERPLVLVHSGLLYQDGRDPGPFFNAVAGLKRTGVVNERRLRIILRASGSESSYARDLKRLHIDDVVTLAPPVLNRAALEEQARADGLLLFQGTRFNRQIPAKLYEYLRIGHPIFAVVDPSGNTADTLRLSGGAEIVPIGDTIAIAGQLAAFIQGIRNDHAPIARPNIVAGFARSAGAKSLATLLDRVTSVPGQRRDGSSASTRAGA